MQILDYFVFGTYFLGIIYVGYYFYRKNSTKEDYYVGGRTISAGHVGLSIAATDVGGGFSIGLGGLGLAVIGSVYGINLNGVCRNDMTKKPKAGANCRGKSNQNNVIDSRTYDGHIGRHGIVATHDSEID